MKTLAILLILFSSLLYSQSEVETKFLYSGQLLDEPNPFANPVCDKIKKNKKVKVIEFHNSEWCKVDYNGCIGYVVTGFIKRNDEINILLEEGERKWQEWLKLELEAGSKKDSLERVKKDEKYKLDSIKRVERVKELKAENTADSLKWETERIETEERERDEFFNKCSYRQNEKDEFTGKVRKNIAIYNVDEYGLNYKLVIQLRRYGNSKTFKIGYKGDLGCVSPYTNNPSFVKFKLENGDIITFYHKGDIDCGDFDLLGKLTASDIARLKRSPIKSVRLSGTEFYQDFTDLFFKDFFIKKLDCIK